MSTSTIKAIWRKLDLSSPSLANLASRSSHSLAILNDKAYLFGGELKPRTPIGNELIAISLNGDSDPQVLDAKSSQSSSWPSARVGATLVSHKPTSSLYLWGGRGGKEMSPLDSQIDDVWKFDVRNQTWTMLETKGDRPVGRSFHTMSQSDEKLFLHAGCPTSGRLSTLHSLDLSTLTWKSLPSAPEPGRGGTVLSQLPNSTFMRWGGFCGEEIGGPLDVFDPLNEKWESFQVELERQAGSKTSEKEPPKRSVHVLVPFAVKGDKQPLLKANGVEKEVVGVLGLGEGVGAPKELGHDGAGKFLSDFYALLCDASSKDSPYSWLPIQTTSSGSGGPQARGWLAFDVQAVSERGCQIVIQGGLNEKNERIDDAWVLHLEVV